MRSETGATFPRWNVSENDITTASLSDFVLDPYLLPRSLIEQTTSSQPRAFECFISFARRANVIRSVRGKYAFVQTSSDEFARRKQTEIHREG